MKITFTLITLCLIVTASQAFTPYGVHPSDSLKKDSLRSGAGLIRITPYPSVQKTAALGFSYYALNNRRVMKNYEGASVFSTQESQVPNLSSYPSYPYYDVAHGRGWRLGQAPLMVIDGIPFSSNLPTFTTLNVFDYSDITVLSGLNGAAGFGVAGGNGAVVLNSKTGEGFNEATYDANSYTTYSYIPPIENLFGPERTQRLWTQSTSMAYQQDFGHADTRISLNHTGNHYNIPWIDKSTNSTYTATMNTGFKITPAFLARLYIQYSKGKVRQNETTSDKNFINTNLRLQYALTPWMKLTSTLAYQHNRFESNATYGTLSKNKQLLGNLFLNIDKKISKHLTLAPFIGIQSSRQEFSSVSNAGIGSYFQKYPGTAWLAGLNTNLDDIWFTSFNYRSDDFTLLPSSVDQSTVSGSTALDLARLFAVTNKIFSSAKIRVAAGTSGIQFPQQYPFFPDQQQAPVTVSGSKTSWEAGADLALFDSRIELSATYFHDLLEDIISPAIPLPLQYDLKTKGFEFVLKMTPVSRRDFNWYASILWGKTDIRVVRATGLAPGNPLIINPNPDIRFSVLNQLSWENWNFNFLLDGRHGGSYFYTSSPGVYEVGDASFVKLRDLSLGYDIVVPDRGISLVRVSAIARNLALISSKSGHDPEEFSMTGTFFKSISLSISLQF